MRQINNTAKKIFTKIMGMMDNNYIKIDNSNGAFMSVSMEVVGQMQDGALLISVAHYFEQNGDLMTDPEVIFIVKKDAHGTTILPVSIQHSFGGVIEGIKINNGEVAGYYPKQQKDIAVFCGQWFANIKQQQF